MNKQILFLIILGITLFLPVTFLPYAPSINVPVSFNIVSAISICDTPCEANESCIAGHCWPTVGDGDGDGAEVTIGGLVLAAVKTTLFIASGIVVIMWVLAGLLFLSVQGNPEKLKSAKTALIAAVGGTLLVIVASSAIYLVGSAFGI